MYVTGEKWIQTNGAGVRLDAVGHSHVWLGFHRRSERRGFLDSARHHLDTREGPDIAVAST